MRKKIVTVLELGSKRIAAAKARIDSRGNAYLLGLENMSSRGIEGGSITDMNKAVEDIKMTVRRLEKSGKGITKHVSVMTKGEDIEMDIYRGMIPLSKTPREITRNDVKKCLGIASMVKFPLDRSIIDKFVSGFYIDGQKTSVNNPLGLYGIRLEAEAFVATANQSKIQNITKCIDHAGFFLDGIHLSSMASARGVLDEAEKEKGVLLLDIGESLTESMIFKNFMLKNFSTVKKGADGLLDGTMRVDNGRQKNLLKEAFAKTGGQESGFSSVVVTGGGALSDGIIEEAENVFKMPARIGIVKNHSRALNSQDAIIHTSTIGLVAEIAEKYKKSNFFKNPSDKVFRRIFDICESYF